MSSQKPTYAIIGGGIAGLTLGIALNKRNINVVIYEAAAHFGEIGAGVAFTANAIEAMKICDPGVYEAFQHVATHNQWESKKNVWFDFLDGMKMDQDSGHQEDLFSISSPVGMNGVHRAAFLDEMVKLVEDQHLAHFGKRLIDCEETEDGKILMKFKDGTTATADALIGCDGIKSVIRHKIAGSDSPAAEYVYTHKYAYRGLIDMDDAVAAIGEERAKNAVMWLGTGRHVLTFPVNKGATMNLVAFCTTEKDWPDYTKSTLPAHREEALKDFEGFGPNVMKLLEMVKPELDIWGIFNLEHELEAYNKGKFVVVGDAGHATSPHHGSGAGFCIEDAAIMATILADPSVTGSPGTIEAAFEAYNTERKVRTQWLVQHSRRQGNLYEYLGEVGRDFNKIEQEITANNFYIEGTDVHGLCSKAIETLQQEIRKIN
ncbi:FAD/NAD(P)-binding domain-containing protein [Microthyrium microscopicum]|uniref:FAD/NAD(P)-binding domain-containing protein n=1 Tax=Microthyrium microscopicum TaxID=703497 RepID=A0A6A6U4D5_9PEZI|nr:FAD/NAD(P)-binding domain-containing protein [Microthyrium microscopicum]